MTKPKRKRRKGNLAKALELAERYGGKISFRTARQMANEQGFGLSQVAWHEVLKRVGKSVLPNGAAGVIAARKAEDELKGTEIVPYQPQSVKRGRPPKDSDETRILRSLVGLRVIELHFVNRPEMPVEMDLLQWRKVRLT